MKYQLYYIENIITKKIYVGFTSKSIKERFKVHINNAKKKINRKLYDSMNHYGYDKFTITQLDEHETKNGICELENWYIYLLKSDQGQFGYNMTKGGDGGYTLGNWTEEERQELYRNQQNNRVKMCLESYGVKYHPQRPEVGKKISESNKGMVISNSHRIKISETLKEKYKNGEITPNIPVVKFANEHPNFIEVDVQLVKKLLNEGKSLNKIAKIIGKSEYSIRSRFKDETNYNIFEYRESVKYNYKSKSEIIKSIKFELSNNFEKTIQEICNEIGVNEYTCRYIWKSEMFMTFDEFRKNVIGIPLNHYGRKIHQLKIQDIDNCLNENNDKLLDISDKLGVSTDLIKKKIKLGYQMTFTEYKKYYNGKN